MELFLSWSGEVSRNVADALDSFIRHVILGVYSFVSTQSIEGGERWEARIAGELERRHHAILCLTRDNQNAPWLNFEAGALSRFTDRARVVPYTIDFPPSEILVGPLSRFQGFHNDEAGTWRLVLALNGSTERPNAEPFLREGFRAFWPTLREQMAQAATSITTQAGPTPKELLLEMREHILEVRNIVAAGSSVNLGRAVEVLASATTDPLTNLANRRAFLSRAQALSAAQTPYVVVLFDIHDFKRVNDQFGHMAGDRVLAFLARTLRKELEPKADIIARVGGDEFAAIVRDTPQNVAEQLHFVPKIPFDSLEFPLDEGITVSVGVSRDQLAYAEDKIAEADRAMYAAKKQGKNVVVIA